MTKRFLTPVLVLALAFVLGFAILHTYDAPQVEAATAQQIGAFPYFIAGSGITKTATSITLTSLTLPQTGALITTSLLSTPFYITLEPGSTARQEFASCTTVTQNSNGTATMTGCTRGLLPITPYTASTTYAFSHSGGTVVIFSNAPQVYQQYPAKDNAETITGTWTFTAFPVTPSTPAATVSVAGFTTLATGLQAASSTAAAGGPSGTTYVLPTNIATDTPTRGCSVGYTAVTGAGCVPIANLIGKLSSSWIPTASSFTWTAPHAFSSTVSLNATTTVATSSVGVSANVPLILVSTSTPAVVNSNNASSTIWQYVIQANTLGKNDTLHIHTSMTDTGCGGTSNMGLFFGTGLSTTTLTATTSVGSTNVYTDTDLFNTGATNSQDSDNILRTLSRPTSVDWTNKTAAFDTTAKTFLALRYFCSNGANAQIRNVTVEKLGSQ